jgi:Family of unknown function (DUF6308)
VPRALGDGPSSLGTTKRRCSLLRLRSGAQIADPLSLARLFIAKDGSCQHYDLADVSTDDMLTERDVRVANRVFARMGADTVAAIVSRSALAAAALSNIPADASLIKTGPEIPWKALDDLYRAFEGLPGIGLPRITKVLHKKRPGLIPILDSVVDRYLVSVEGPVVGGLADRGTALTRAYKAELDACLPVLACVRAELLTDGIKLTECRLLDLYLWAYSGQYDPLWRRTVAPAIAAPTPPRPAASTIHHLTTTDEVEIFRDAESKYLAWITRHPKGWVVNCTRSPSPAYLLLHRADCWTVSVRGAGNYTTREYIKVCSVHRSTLDSWAVNSVGGGLVLCGFCEGRLAREAR